MNLENEDDQERIGKWKVRVDFMWTKIKRFYGVREGGKYVGVDDDKG